MAHPMSAARSLVSALMLSSLLAIPSLAVETIQTTARAASTQPVEFDVILPLTHRSELDQLLEAQQTPGSPQYHRWLTPAQFREQFGPSKASIARVTAELNRLGLRVSQVHGHGVRVQGEAAAVESAFSTSLWMGKDKRGAQTIVREGTPVLPSVLASESAQVFAFSPTVRLHPNVKTNGIVQQSPDNRYGRDGLYWFTDLKEAYQAPAYQVASGKGVTIGILMSSDYSQADMNTYFTHEGVATPAIFRRPVNGGAPYDPVHNGGTFEVTLDLQQAGGFAPKSQLVLYNIPDLGDPSVIAGYLAIVEDNFVDIVSSSFGGSEALYTAEYNDGQDFTGILRTFNDLFKQGNAQGITFIASSGDSGALAKPPVEYFTTAPTKPASVVGYWQPGTEWPSSDPNVTSVGGTNLVTTYTAGSLTSNYVSENAFGDPENAYDPYGFGNLVAGGYWGSGGGVSAVFGKPAYQKLVATGSPKFRVSPDVSLHMGGCPRGLSITPCGPDRSGDILALGGSLYGVIGTSASAPDFAGILALREEYTGSGRLGNVNPLIYQQAADQARNRSALPSFRNNIPGFNGYYLTRRGYNPVLGVGTVIVRNFIGAGDQPAAGDPASPSNP